MYILFIVTDAGSLPAETATTASAGAFNNSSLSPSLPGLVDASSIQPSLAAA